MSTLKILVADDEPTWSQKVKALAVPHGLEVRIANNGPAAEELLTSWKPHYVLADLTLPQGGAYQLLRKIKTEPSLRHHPMSLIVLSEHSQSANVKEAVRRGALDYIVKPCAPAQVIQRLLFHLQPKRLLKQQSPGLAPMDQTNLMLHLIDLVLRQAQSQQPILKKLYQLTRMLSLKMSGVRCSIVHCVSIVEGIVLASHDHEGAFGIELELQKYPEILQVIHTGQLVAIENLSKQPDLAHLVQVEKEIQFNSMILCPLLKKKEFFGVLSLRLPLDRTIILDYEIRFVEVVSQIVNLCLSNASNDVDDLLKALHKGIHGPSVASPLPTEEKPKNAKLLRFKGHRK